MTKFTVLTVRHIVIVLAALANQGISLLSFIASFRHLQSSYVIEKWENGDLRSEEKVAVFSHYEKTGRLHDYVEHYLRQIRDAGYAIIFVTSSPKLSAETVDRLLRICSLILRRKNLGRDFGAYKDGVLQIADVRELQSLLLTNDSVYGPFTDLSQVLERMAPAGADMWGLTDSWERRYHLQSYFLLFHRKVLQNETFLNFWRKVRYVQSKEWLIKNYEIGLSGAMIAAGFRCKPLFPYRGILLSLTASLKMNSRDKLKMEASRDGLAPEVQYIKDLDPQSKKFLTSVIRQAKLGTPCNPTHFFWDYLIKVMGYPFLKRELLCINPSRVPSVFQWEQAVRSVSNYDVEFIDSHLKCSLRNRSA